MNKIIISYGLQLDFHISNHEYEQITNLIEDIEKYLEGNKFSTNENFQLHYILGNAWYFLFTHKKISKNIIFTENNLVNQTIINYRKAKSYINDDLKVESICNLFTNLGNMFNELGRPIEAFRNWNNTLKVDNKFNMALGNLGYGIYRYANLLYDPSHIHLLNREAFYIISKIENDHNYEDVYNFFESIKLKISERYPSDFLEKTLEDEESWPLGNNEDEIDYKNWVLQNKLFLNPLNDIFTHTIVAHDILSLPNIIITQDMDYNKPTYHSLFNNIKQEYISLRYLYYLSQNMQEFDLHFSDKDTHLFDTLDYPQFGLKFEYLKLSFRMAYSIFDKIAYFLNYYLKLGIKPNSVSYRRIWYKNIKKQLVKDEIIKLSNTALNGLFIISKDFYEENESFKSSLDPESKNTSEIRNYIEHRGINIHSDIIGDFEDIDINYSIGESIFQKRTYNLIQKCREAIIYLSLAVNIEEQNKINSDDFYIPIINPELDFNFN